MNVTLARYAVGVASLLLVLGSLGGAAVALRRRWLHETDGALARLAEVVIALALLLGILELLGAVGLFALGPVLCAAALVGIVVLAGARRGRGWGFGRLRRGRRRPVWGVRRGTLPGALRGYVSRTRRGPLPGSRHGIFSGGPHEQPRPPERGGYPRTALAAGGPLQAGITVFALLVAGAVMAAWASPTLHAYDAGIHSFDSLWYHLPWAASFAQTGHITPLRFTDVEYLTAFYPATAELLHGLGIVLLARDTLSPGLNLVWLGLVLLAGWCVGRARGAAPATLVASALAMSTPMLNFSQPAGAANDVVGVFFLLAAVAFVLSAEGRPAMQVLAAVSAGLAVAVKLSLLAPVLALTVGAIAFAPGGARLRAAARWLVPLLLAGGFWYVRNLIAVGNPLPWTSLGFLPTPAPPLQEHTGFSIAHYLFKSGVWSHFFEPGLAAGLGPWWYLILAMAVIGPVLCLLPGAGRVTRMLGLVALASLAAYMLTPESAAGPAGDPSGFAFNLRYAAPALTLSLALLPIAPVLRTPRRQLVLTLGLAAPIVELIAHSSLYPKRHSVGAIALGGVFALAALAALWQRRSIQWRPRIRIRVTRALLGALAGALVVAGVAEGFSLQRHYLDSRYRYTTGVSDLARVWALFRGIHDARVALVGTFGGFFSYPLFGEDDSNRVQYVAERGRRGSFTPIPSCQAWRRAIDAGHFHYVVTTPARDPWHPSVLSPSPEAGWTASDPAARLVFGRRAHGQEVAVYELSGPMDPAGCPSS